MKLWNIRCNMILRMKLKADRIIYSYAENKGQGENITKSYQWLLMRVK